MVTCYLHIHGNDMVKRSVKGYGFCKESTALAKAAGVLIESVSANSNIVNLLLSLDKLGGVGMDTCENAFKKHGFTLISVI